MAELRNTHARDEDRQKQPTLSGEWILDDLCITYPPPVIVPSSPVLEHWPNHDRSMLIPFWLDVRQGTHIQLTLPEL